MKSNILGTLVSASLLVIAFSVVVTNFDKDWNSGRIVVSLSLPPVKFVSDDEFVGQTVAVSQADLDCMAKNLYFEARNQESEEAMAAVGYTVLNRVAARQYPDTICQVVYQGQRDSNGQYRRHRCQFSWVCDGVTDEPKLTTRTSKGKVVPDVIEIAAWERAQRVATGVLYGTIDNPVGNSTMYHATYVNPYWVKAFSQVAQIEDHIFYEKA